MRGFYRWLAIVLLASAAGLLHLQHCAWSLGQAIRPAGRDEGRLVGFLDWASSDVASGRREIALYARRRSASRKDWNEVKTRATALGIVAPGVLLCLAGLVWITRRKKLGRLARGAAKPDPALLLAVEEQRRRGSRSPARKPKRETGDA